MAQAFPGKWKLRKIPLVEAGEQDYAEEGSRLLCLPSVETLASPTPVMLTSRLLMGIVLARCSGWYFLCVTYINHHRFDLQVYM